MGPKEKTKAAGALRAKAREKKAPPELSGQKDTYILGDRIGMGGMAEVFRAKSKSAGVEVAVKRPLSGLKKEDKSLFLREAEAASRAAGDGVVRVLDWGGDPPFIVFEFVSDPTLENEIQRRRDSALPWSSAELIVVFRQLVAAMRVVNAQVLHRDIKPANIFVGDTTVRISDFGLAKFVDEATRSRTFKHWGTAPYIAPESWQGLSVDWRADQYSLGVVFFELATFKRPFGGSESELERDHLYKVPKRIDSIVSGFSARLSVVVNKMLEKRREDRYSSWDAIEDDLVSAAQALAHPARELDPLAVLAAKNLESFKQLKLQHIRTQDERAAASKRREELADYWWRVLSDFVDERVRRLNEHVGNQIKVLLSGRKYELGFLNAQSVIWISPVSLSASGDAVQDVVLWGGLRTSSPKEELISQLFLLAEPLPYGTWMKAEMILSPLVRQANEIDIIREARVGSYEVTRGRGLVVAKNVEGIVAQRALKNVTSLVDYNEAPLDFSGCLESHLTVFVEGSAAPRASDRSLF